MISRWWWLGLLLTLLLVSPVLADQIQIRNYDTARQLVWGRLYIDGGFTFYCGEPFEDKTGLNVEHLYPTSWMAAFLGCGTRKECRKTNERFNRMEADLHNLFPVRADIKQARSDFRFGMIKGEVREFGDCNFERDKDSHVAEPRPVTRGNIARVIFYMHAEYGLPIDHRDVDILKEWNRSDPPSNHEMQRNGAIDVLQGTRNQFIDHPKFVEDLEF